VAAVVEPAGRWERLFADLEAQAAAELRAETEGELADRTRHARGQVPFVDRLRAARGRRVTVRLAGGVVAAGIVGDVAREWLLLRQDGSAAKSGAPSLVPLDAVRSAEGLGRDATPAVSPLAELPLRSMLRIVARDRSPVRVWLTDGQVLDGTVDEVGRDHLDIAAHPLDEPRRPGSVRQVHLVVLSAIALVRPAEGTSSLGW
jgi:small nuclear ribonucleoprotein (snRNP)-like protein